MTPEEAIKTVKSNVQSRTRCAYRADYLDEVLVTEIERLRNIVSTTLLYRNENDIMFDCPRCSHSYKLSDTDSFASLDSIDTWCCGECEITLHYSDTTFLEILAQVQKRYAF